MTADEPAAELSQRHQAVIETEATSAARPQSGVSKCSMCPNSSSTLRRRPESRANDKHRRRRDRTLPTSEPKVKANGLAPPPSSGWSRSRRPSSRGERPVAGLGTREAPLAGRSAPSCWHQADGSPPQDYRQPGSGVEYSPLAAACGDGAACVLGVAPWARASVTHPGRSESAGGGACRRGRRRRARAAASDPNLAIAPRRPWRDPRRPVCARSIADQPGQTADDHAHHPEDKCRLLHHVAGLTPRTSVGVQVGVRPADRSPGLRGQPWGFKSGSKLSTCSEQGEHRVECRRTDTTPDYTRRTLPRPA